MCSLTLLLRNLQYHWAAQTAVMLAVVIATATSTGALLVGDAMRGSLRTEALERLGRVDHALLGDRFLRAGLADEIATYLRGQGIQSVVVPAILLRGAVTHAVSRALSGEVQVLGIDARFAPLDPEGVLAPLPARRHVVLNAALANEIGAAPGDDLLLRIGRPNEVPTETLLGRRDDTALTLRLTVGRICAAEGVGGFSLWPQQYAVPNLFVDLPTLQRLLEQENCCNALLASIAASDDTEPHNQPDLNAAMRSCITLEDIHLTTRLSEQHGYVALESSRFLLEPAAEALGRDAAARIEHEAVGVLSYLANTIALVGHSDARREVPYSTVAAVGPLPQPLVLRDEQSTGMPQPGEIYLNTWAAHDLDARVGDKIELTYYIHESGAGLRTEKATFRLAGITPLTGPAADTGFTPEYRGVTNVDSIADWDPPFPLNLDRIRPRDEAYWEQYRTMPKAFLALEDGQRLWSATDDRFGRLTSLRIYAKDRTPTPDLRRRYAKTLQQSILPAAFGLTWQNVRTRALAAARGSTDFGGLFIGFSYFLVIAAALLIALLFRLNIDRRGKQIGLCLALGFTPARVRRFLVLEGAIIAGLGAAIGLFAARGYAWLMLLGLRTWWADAVRAPFLELHETAQSYIIGFGLSVAVALVAMTWSLRGLLRLSARDLLSGAVARDTGGGKKTPVAYRWGAVLALIGALIVIAAGQYGAAFSESLAYFVGGTALLLAGLLAAAAWLRRGNAPTILPGPAAMPRIAARNARRRTGRSLLIVALVSFATFVIVSLHALRLAPPADPTVRSSGTGGFTLYATSAAPIPYDLASPEAQQRYGLAALFTPETESDDPIRCYSLRLRDGDETSCLNLYRPTQPRLLGIPNDLIERGGFAFAATAQSASADGKNPWHLLLNPGGAIADEAAVRWQMHTQVGQSLQIRGQNGEPHKLPIVATTRGSFLQGEVLISEQDFLTLFPDTAGYRFFLFEVPPPRADAVAAELERQLSPFGFDVHSTRQRLSELQAVQNTYLATFQTLGGLGLLLGTIGLGIIAARNVLERQAELALLQALGFDRAAIITFVLSENALLVAMGLTCGASAGFIALLPRLLNDPSRIPVLSLLSLLGLVFVSGLAACAAAVMASVRRALLPSLRSE